MPTTSDIAFYDPAKWSRRRAAISPRYSFAATDIASAKRWQSTLRRRFIGRLGGFPAEAAPLKARVLSREEYTDHTRETLRFQSREGLWVFAYFLLPKNQSTPVPAMLCLPGHSYGVDALVGLDAHGKPRKGEDYQKDFALQCVRNGYATLAIEILGFGRRREGISKGAFPPGAEGNTCGTLTGSAFMLGESMAGWRTYDAMRAVDYLQTREEVDAKRIGAMGISGGGLNALFLAAVDRRIKATMVSGYLNTFRESVMQINHCIDNYIPGLLLDAEMTDIAGLIAPRALWCENGSQDNIFPVKVFRRALRETQNIYQVFGAREKCSGEVFEGEHQFYGKKSWPFLEKHLKQD